MPTKDTEDAEKRVQFPKDIDSVILKFTGQITNSLTNIADWYKALGQIIDQKDRLIKQLTEENKTLTKKVGKKKAAKLTK